MSRAYLLAHPARCQTYPTCLWAPINRPSTTRMPYRVILRHPISTMLLSRHELGRNPRSTSSLSAFKSFDHRRVLSQGATQDHINQLDIQFAKSGQGRVVQERVEQGRWSQYREDSSHEFGRQDGSAQGRGRGTVEANRPTGGAARC